MGLNNYHPWSSPILKKDPEAYQERVLKASIFTTPSRRRPGRRPRRPFVPFARSAHGSRPFVAIAPFVASSRCLYAPLILLRMPLWLRFRCIVVAFRARYGCYVAHNGVVMWRDFAIAAFCGDLGCYVAHNGVLCGETLRSRSRLGWRWPWWRFAAFVAVRGLRGGSRPS